MKHLIAVSGMVLALSGCAGLSQDYATENYIIDLERGKYCIEGTKNCRALSLIAPSFRDEWVADAYGMPDGYYAFDDKDLAKIVINPPDDSYKAEQITLKQFRVPPTYATHMVWDVLNHEDFLLYGDEFAPGNYPFGPAPRRH